ncbi:MAG TPA: DUF2934 domain-containing protein [Acetobacteraceae bacterium]|jgi:hypothetical protein
MAFEVEDHIRVRAYHLWEANGRPEGRDLEFWEQARQSIALHGQAVESRRGATRSQTGGSAAAKASKRGRRTTRAR